VHAESLEVVVRSREPGNLELTAIAGARVDLTDGQGATENPGDLRCETLADPLDLATSRWLGDDARAKRCPELTKHRSASPGPARFLLELTKHRLASGQLIVEDPARHVEQVPDKRIAYGVPDGRALFAGGHDVLRAQDGQLLGHGGLVEIELGLELLDAPSVRAQDFQDPDADRVRERLEELGLEGLKIRGLAHAQ
jgi:hypothetical protein